MSYILKGKYVYTSYDADNAGLLRDGAVYFDGQTIREVGGAAELCRKYPEATVLGGDDYAVLPGLIDAHTHGSGLSYVQRGPGFDYLENSQWEWPGAVVLPPELNAPLAALRHLQNGCTTMHQNVMGIACDEKAAETSARYLKAYQKTGMRVAYSPGIRDENQLVYGDADFYRTLPPDLQAFIRPRIFFDRERARDMFFDWFEEVYQTFDSDMCRILLGPCWAHGASEELLLRTKRTAEDHGHLPIHIHTLQTPIQRGFGLKAYGKSLLRRMEDLGIVDDNLTLGHAVYLDEEDIEILRRRGASITHHVSCNFAMRNGISPVWYLQRAGVNVALGIDEKGINDDEDPFMELRMIYYVSRVSGFDLEHNQALTANEVFEMGARNAARTIGFGGRLGAVAPGMKADLILLDLTEIEKKPCVAETADPTETLMHRALGRFVTDVFVNGRPVIRNKACTTIDVDALYREVRDFVAREPDKAQQHYAAQMRRLQPYVQAWYRGMDNFPRQPYYPVNSRI